MNFEANSVLFPNYHEEVIEQHTRKKKNTIYGARAMNKQLHGRLLGIPLFARPTFDYDIYSHKPKQHAREIECMLDKFVGEDLHYTKPALHKGTHKVMHRGMDRRKGTHDDFGIADLTKPTRKIKIVSIEGIKYARLSERIKDARKSLKNPMFKFRHEKDRQDLWLIQYSRKWRF